MKRIKGTNIIKTNLAELTKLGYKQLKPEYDKKKNYCLPLPENSLLCLCNKGQDLWAELNLYDIKASRVNADKFIIYFK